MEILASTYFRNEEDTINLAILFSFRDDGRIKIRRDDQISYRLLTNPLMPMFDDA